MNPQVEANNKKTKMAALGLALILGSAGGLVALLQGWSPSGAFGTLWGQVTGFSPVAWLIVAVVVALALAIFGGRQK